MLLPHFKRTNLCAHGTPALTHMAGAFPDPRERMMDMVESFVQRQNVKHYTRQLMTESDTNKREICKSYWPKKSSNKRAALCSKLD